MFPSEAARLLREFGHDAVGVTEIGLGGAVDHDVAIAARIEERVMVTENVADFARYQDLVLVCVLKRSLPSGGGQARALAVLLDQWGPAPLSGV